MIKFPGRRYVNILLPRRTKEGLFRTYNFIVSKFHKKLTYPKYISICLTTRCNLRCTICDRSDFQTSDMDFNNIYKLENAIKHAKNVDLTGWGEAILYKKYADVIAYIFSLNRRRKLISQTSNGLMAPKYAELLRGRLQRFVISLNAATPETYNREMKGGDFNKTISSVKTFMSQITSEDRNAVELHFVAHLNNYREMPLFVELAKSLGVMQVSYGQYLCNNPDSEKNSLLNVKHRYNEILTEVDAASKKFKVEAFYRRFGENLGLSTKNCTFPYERCFVLTNGDISPCCYLGDTSIGNVFDNSFESVWFGNNMQMLRKSRYLPACLVCAPFHSFDNPACHFTSRYNLQQISKKAEA